MVFLCVYAVQRSRVWSRSWDFESNNLTNVWLNRYRRITEPYYYLFNSESIFPYFDLPSVSIPLQWFIDAMLAERTFQNQSMPWEQMILNSTPADWQKMYNTSHRNKMGFVYMDWWQIGIMAPVELCARAPSALQIWINGVTGMSNASDSFVRAAASEWALAKIWRHSH